MQLEDQGDDRFPNIRRLHAEQQNSTRAANRIYRRTVTDEPVREATATTAATRRRTTSQRQFLYPQQNEPESDTKPRAPRKLSKLMDSLFNMDVRARSWEAKSLPLLELERYVRDLELKSHRSESELATLQKAIREMRNSGVDDGSLLHYFGQRMASSRSQQTIFEKRTERRNDPGEKVVETSLAERERQAQLELEAQKLTVMKLVGIVIRCNQQQLNCITPNIRCTETTAQRRN